jgi:hypothetical protein
LACIHHSDISNLKEFHTKHAAYISKVRKSSKLYSDSPLRL